MPNSRDVPDLFLIGLIALLISVSSSPVSQKHSCPAGFCFTVQMLKLKLAEPQNFVCEEHHSSLCIFAEVEKGTLEHPRHLPDWWLITNPVTQAVITPF